MHFTNETGLDEKDASGGYGTARDMAYLIAWALHNDPHLFEATTEESASFTSLSDKTHIAKNTDEIVNKIPSLIASKTGYTELAGGNLAIAFDAGLQRPIVVVVLGSSIEGRFKDVETLVQASFEYLSKSTK
jgi:D-alanyl-D-alanine carboxypeptidase